MIFPRTNYIREQRIYNFIHITVCRGNMLVIYAIAKTPTGAEKGDRCCQDLKIDLLPSLRRVDLNIDAAKLM